MLPANDEVENGNELRNDTGCFLTVPLVFFKTNSMSHHLRLFLRELTHSLVPLQFQNFAARCCLSIANCDIKMAFGSLTR